LALAAAGRHDWRTSESAPNPSQASSGPAPSRKQHALELFSALPRQYDYAGAAHSFGQDPRWRRALVDVVAARPGQRVLDVATGTAMVASELVRRYGVNVVALDQSPQMLAAAKARIAASPQLSAHVTLLEGEAERLPFADAEFDHLTFTYLLRYVDDPAATLAELARVVAPGGRIAMLEFGEPDGEPWRALWGIYTSFGLPVLGRLISPEWAQAGRFLSHSIPGFYARHPLAMLPALWREAGIVDVQIRLMSFGAGVVMWGTRDRASAAS
jgi:demethylmenaquinone methyltransferase/2-methoxy-6-polyprenyl-1,4-benzoquinol methylase